LRRARTEIIQEILECLLEQAKSRRKCTMTRLQKNVGLPWPDLLKYVNELRKAELVTYGSDLQLTVKGEELLKALSMTNRKIRRLLSRR
jgi:predicted transcriptional regulator